MRINTITSITKQFVRATSWCIFYIGILGFLWVPPYEVKNNWVSESVQFMQIVDM